MMQNSGVDTNDWAKFKNSIIRKEQRADSKKQQRRVLRKKFETLKPDGLCTALETGSFAVPGMWNPKIFIFFFCF